jgi:hypothetical protein
MDRTCANQEVINEVKIKVRTVLLGAEQICKQETWVQFMCMELRKHWDLNSGPCACWTDALCPANPGSV